MDARSQQYVQTIRCRGGRTRAGFESYGGTQGQCDQVSQNAKDGQEARSQGCGKGVETKEEGIVRVLCLKNQQTTQSCPG